MEGLWPIIFLAVVLKIPVGLLLYLVWWAFRAQPAIEEAPPPGDDHEFRRFRRDPNRPHGPRRGPHAPDSLPLPACPPGGRSRVARPVAPLPAGAGSSGRRGNEEPV